MATNPRWLGVVLAMGAIGAGAGAAELSVDVGDAGLLEGLKLDGQPAAASVGLLVPKPDWQGNQGSLREARVTRRGGDLATGPLRIEGRLSAGDDPALAYVCTLERQAGGLHVAYEITPRRDTDAAGVVAQILLEVPVLQGRDWVTVAGETVRKGTFPRELPDPYNFFSESAFERLTWPASADTWLALVPDWQTVERVNVQDDRRFGMAAYEIQIYARVPRVLAQGQPVRLGFSLVPASAAEVQALQARAEARSAALRASLRGTAAAAAVRAVKAGGESVPAYGRFEADVEIEARYDNPFDPAQVALEGHFVTPSGREETVPGFCAWDYERALRNGTEQVTPTGQGGWRVRYCPREPGRYRYWVTLASGGTTARSPEATFACTPSSHPGFVRIGKGNPLYFETDEGQPYFAIGENVCWPGRGGTFEYDRYWQRLAENGANYARVWIGPFDCFTLERPARGPDDTAGLGRIDLAAAWRIDYLLDLAEKHGIRVMFCIDSFNSLRISQPYPAWANCPYNAANGGPLAAPEQFFTDAKARELFRNRLRYIVARWGHQTSVLSWEFWNEVDIIEKYVSADSVAWHREMARYLRSIDCAAHLITTSWAGTGGDPAVDGLPEMDYIQSHQYGAHDPAAFMARICREKAARFGKPHYFGEFGTGTEAQGTGEDKSGIHLHDGLWSGLMSQGAGTGMLWWWDNYVEPNNLYHHFRPVAEFARGLPLTTTRFQPLQPAAVTYAGTPPPTRLEELELTPEAGSWEPAPFNQPNRFVVRPDGKVDNGQDLARVLHGKRNHPKLHNPATFEVDYPSDGEFAVNVAGVSGHGGANLRLFVDDRQVLAKDLLDEDKGTDTLNQYNGRYAVPVPAGEHTIRVVNDGNDWVYVSYTLPAYRRRDDPGLQVYGLANGSTTAGQVAAILWLKNERCTWFLHNRGIEPGTIPPTNVRLGAIPDGAYEVEWWDTATGKPGERTRVSTTAGTLTVTAPAFTSDVAAKVWRAGE